VRTTTGSLAIVPLFLLENLTVSHGAIRLWGLLYARFSDREGTSTPSRAEMAAALDQSTDTIDRWIKQLTRAGVLRVIPHEGTQPRRIPNQYELTVIDPSRIHTAPLPAPIPTTKKERGLLDGDEAATGGGVHTEVAVRERGSRKVQVHISTKAYEKFPRWTQFYQRYPRKNRKASAHKAWIKLGAEDNEELFLAIMVGLRKYLAVWQRDNTERRYIPYPATFLNGRQWEDALEDEPPALVLSKQTRTMVSATERFLSRHNGGLK